VNHKGEFSDRDGERIPDAYAGMGEDLARVDR
jgi:hypothetical protein